VLKTIDKRDSCQFAVVCEAALGESLRVRFRANGQSMQPNVLDGDTVVVAPISTAGKPAVGDIALMRGEDGFVLHRVVAIDAATGAIVTRGDAGQQNDPCGGKLLGKAVAIERDGRTISLVAPGTALRHSVRTQSRRLQRGGLRMAAKFRGAVVPAIFMLFAFLLYAATASAQADLAVTADSGAPTPIAAGAQITYTITVVNNSTTNAATNPTITDVIPAGTTYVSFTRTSGTGTWPCTGVSVGGTGTLSCQKSTTLAASGTATFAFVVMVPAGTVVGTTFINSASISSTTTDPNPLNNTLIANTVTVGPTPDISVTDSASPTSVATGGQITYTQTVTNNSALVAAAGPSLTETTPAGTTYASDTVATGWACTTPAAGSTGTITCTPTLGTMLGGTSAVFTIVVNVNPEVTVGSTITNTVTVSETGTDPVPGNNTATATATVQGADLGMTQVASATAAAPGGTITYTESVTNNGPNAATTPVLYQQTPPNTTFVSMAAPTGWTCTAPAAGATGQVVCTDGASLNSGASATGFSFVVTINPGPTPAAPAAGTTILNSADVTSATTDPIASNNSTTTSVLVQTTGDADMSLTMSVNPTPAFVSSPITYTIQIQDLGLSAGTVVSVVDTLPAGSVLQNPVGKVTPTSAGSCAAVQPPVSPSTSPTITCTLGTVAYPTGSPITITITGTTPGTAQTITNSATVSTTATDPVSANNSATILTIVQPLVCSTPGKDGAGGTLSGIVNTYFPPGAGVTGAAAGTTSIVLGAAAATPAAQTPIAIGDRLLIIQMQNATINSTNTSSYGDGVAGDPGSGSTNPGSSGLFEYVTATSAVAATGGTLSFTGAGASSGLVNSYFEAAAAPAANPTTGQSTFQVIRVPQYTTAVLSSSLDGLSWNGSVGGVLALDVATHMTLGGTVALDAQGFRGGAGQLLTKATTPPTPLSTDYVTLSTQTTNAPKGEGIAGTPITVANAALTTVVNSGNEGYPNGAFARGAPGNAGGGATDADPANNDQNSGGGGGGNGGVGGNGGFGWSSAGIVGGYGGAPFAVTTNAITMGGGGGAGTTNNGSYWNPTTDTGNNNCGALCTGINSSGTAGGGIIIIHAGTITGTGTITANGQLALETENDGGGGGGAGGTIIVLTNNGGVSGLTVSAVGGNGGVTWPEQTPGAFPGNRHGPGAGGGGGVVFTSSAPAGANVSGGAPGWTTLADDAYGATSGQPGIFVSGSPVQGNPGAQSGAYCAAADIAVTNSAVPSPVVPGNNITYTQTVTNNGPVDGIDATMTEVVPANTTFQSIVVSGAGAAGWTCTNPAVGGTGVITCTNPDIPSGASGAATFTVVAKVNAGTTNGTQITDTITATSDTNDPNTANNSATVATIVGAAGTANLAVTNVGSPNPVVQGQNITYTVTVTNNGPSAASSPVFSETLPTNTTFVSVAASSGTTGWTCSSSAISCSIGSLAVGASTTFTVVVKVGAGVAAGTIITDTAQVTSNTTDPNPSNNFATVTTVVASSSSQADLALTKTGTPNPVLAGNNITYTIVVTNNGPGTASTVTMTDTLPASTTVVSITPPSTPTGWTCPAPSAGKQTCTNASLVSGAASTSTFTLVLKVTAGTAPGTVITNSATVSSSTSDPTTTNNTAMTSSTVASPTQADVSIIKTASPEPVDQGTNLTYTLQVTNNGPAVATGVTVTDVLPSQVTYSSLSIPSVQGSCTYTSATTTVSCSLNNMNVGALVIITINVNAATFSSSTTSSNTATVSATTGDPNSTNNSSTAISTIQAATAVDLSSFRAFTRPGGGVLLEWKTREESRNLGFHLYREDGQGRHQVDPSLIAGSALLLRGGQPQHKAKTYQWIDPQGNSLGSYWIEDVDINGTRTMHGPVYAETASISASANPEPFVQARLLRQLNQLGSSVVATSPSPADAPSATIARVLSTPRPMIAQVVAGETPASLNGESAVKISVTTEGWYQVTRNQLVAAGLPVGVDARTLQLFAEGVEQPMLILGRQSGALGANDSIEFYGTGIDTPFSATRVYWLVRGSRAGKRISAVPAAGRGTGTNASFPFTVLFQQRLVYFAALLNGENNDNFFGATITSDPTDQSVTLANIDHSSSMPVTMDLTLQGVTDQQSHAVSIAFNGVPVGELDFANLTNATQTFGVPSGLLQNGANTVSLTALNGDNDVSLVQSIQIHYPHLYAADSDWLESTASSGDTVHIGGFRNAQVDVFDVTDPLAITQLTGPIASDNSGFGITLSIPGGRGVSHTLLALASDQISAPSGLAFHAPSTLDKPQSGADLVVISYPDFEASVAPLVKFHESRGTSVDTVTVDEIYDAFNFGEKSPFALQNFLKVASTSWRNKPQGVLLVGDASFDPRDYLGFGPTDFVPTRMIQTAAFKTASDDWLTDFNQTGFGTIPIGRLPVGSVADANLVVSKIVGYDKGTGAGGWNQQALVVSDQNIDANFTATANAVSLLFPAGLNVTKIQADGQDPSVVQPQILAALNSGSLIVDYIGHGSEEQWSFANFLDDTSAATLANGNRLPVFVLMDCLNGFFQDVYATSLSTSLMLAPNGGGVAVWASSGFTDAGPQATMNQSLISEWKSNPLMPIGQATLAAKLNITDPDVRRTWNLFGDPLMSLQVPAISTPHPTPRIRPFR
jgi:uncharacterized repeat protein (TIGR01451 family)